MGKPKQAFAEAYATAAPKSAPRARRTSRRLEPRTSAPTAPGVAQQEAATRLDPPQPHAQRPTAAFVARAERPTLPENLFAERAVEQPAADAAPADVSTTAAVAAPDVGDLSWLEAMNRAAAGLEHTAATWEPALEVPHFAWPGVVVDLLAAAGDALRLTVERLVAFENGSRRIVFFAGGGSGAGCTTTLLSVAHSCAEQGRKAVLVDADFANAALATQLGLRIETGWPTMLGGDLPLGESLVESLAGRLVLAPLATPIPRPETLLASDALPRLWAELAARFDLVLVDAGSLSRAGHVAALVGERTDAQLVFVQDVRRPVAAELNYAQRCFPNLRDCPTSIAQNFVRA